MSFEERQELLRLVVDRITVEDETVRIETVIPQGDDYSQLRTRHGEPVEPPLLGGQMRHWHDLCTSFDGAQDERIADRMPACFIASEPVPFVVSSGHKSRVSMESDP